MTDGGVTFPTQHFTRGRCSKRIDGYRFLQSIPRSRPLLHPGSLFPGQFEESVPFNFADSIFSESTAIYPFWSDWFWGGKLTSLPSSNWSHLVVNSTGCEQNQRQTNKRCYCICSINFAVINCFINIQHVNIIIHCKNHILLIKKELHAPTQYYIWVLGYHLCCVAIIIYIHHKHILLKCSIAN